MLPSATLPKTVEVSLRSEVELSLDSLESLVSSESSLTPISRSGVRSMSRFASIGSSLDSVELERAIDIV